MNLRKHMTPVDLAPAQTSETFQIYIDHNTRSVSGAAGRRYVSCKATLEEAIEECQRITRDSLLVLYTPPMSAADLNYAYLESGADPFIVGAPYVPFSAWAFARDCCCDITGEAPEPPLSYHPCDKKPPPHLTNNPTARPVMGTWRKDARCIHYLPNPYGEACRLAQMQGASVFEAFVKTTGETFANPRNNSLKAGAC